MGSGEEASSPAAETAAPVVEEPAAPAQLTEFEQRVADLLVIKSALEAYHADNGSYPDTQEAWASVAHRKANNWLPELVPTYLPVVPQDPGKSWNSEDAQYLYKSNGAGFKLIAHKSGDCDQLTDTSGVTKDPQRSNVQKCWAYGAWTPDFTDK